MNDSALFTQLLFSVERLLADYVARAEQGGKLSAEAERQRSLFGEFQRIVTPLLEANDTTLPKMSADALTKALHLVHLLIEAAETHVQARATEYLRDAALDPARAAEAGSLLCEALVALIALAERQLAWLEARFKQTWWERRRRSDYKRIGPCDLDIRLIELMTALHTTMHDAETALRRLDLLHHPVNDLLLHGKPNGNDSSSLTTVESLTPRTIVTKTSAPLEIMESLRLAHARAVNLVKSHASDALDIVRGGSHQGGGVDPRAVRTASVMTVRLCVIALKQAQEEHKKLTDYELGIVEASPAPPKGPGGGGGGTAGASTAASASVTTSGATSGPGHATSASGAPPGGATT